MHKRKKKSGKREPKKRGLVDAQPKRPLSSLKESLSHILINFVVIL